MVSDSAPDPEGAADRETVPNPGALADHAKLASERLGAPAARGYLQRLRMALVDDFDDAWRHRGPLDIAAWLATCPCDEDSILDYFVPVRRALTGLPDGVVAEREAACDAAAALYFLLVCRAVSIGPDAAHGRTVETYSIPIPDHDDVALAKLIAAITATALFGGALHILRDGVGDMPQVDGVFEITGTGVGDQILSDFERAVYVALFRDRASTIDVAQEDGPLTPRQRDDVTAALAAARRAQAAAVDRPLSPRERAQMNARLREERRVYRKSLALLVREDRFKSVCGSFATQHRVPVVIPGSEVTADLLGMDIDTLVAEVQAFWAQLKALRAAEQRGNRGAASYQGGQEMPGTGDTHNYYGNTYHNSNHAESHGTKSQAVAGQRNVTTHTEQHGVDPEQMVLLLEALEAEIASLDPGRARERLEGHLTAVQAEVAKPDGDRDRGVIKAALDAIETIADALDNGGRIMGHLAKAAPWLPDWFPGGGVG